ncbi:MAG: FtsX-like permease family protein [Bacteroidota bacterium]
MSGLESWMLLPEGTDPEQVETQIASLLEEHLDTEYSRRLGFGLQPLREVHLAPDFQNNAGTYTTSKSNLILVTFIGLLILIIGSINFINLSNAQGMRRMKEVGVRKVMGANKASVRIQFLTETYLMVFISIVLAIIIVEIFLPYVNDFFGSLLELSLYKSVYFPLFIVLLFILIGFMSGFYPSVFLSGFKAVDTLKNSVKSTGNFSIYLRNGLLLLQFIITVGLLASVFVINKQMNFVNSKDLGFKKDKIVTFRIPDPTEENIAEVAQLLSANPNVGRFTFGLGAPTSTSNMGSSYSSPEMETDDELSLNLKMVDTGYLHTFGLELLAGEWLQPKDSDDSLYNLVVNEKLIHSLQINDPAEAVGMRLQVSGIPGRIVGVVKNFHLSSLKSRYMAVAFLYHTRYFHHVMIHIPSNYQTTVQQINDELAQIFPDYVINHTTVEAEIKGMYERDRYTLSLLKFFSMIAALIAFLGLFGLVSFHMVRKTKEIGIRKVLGASIPGLIVVLTRWQVGLLFIASIIGSILSWYFVKDWLDTYVYRINFPFWIFPAVFLLLLVINFLTISFHVYKTARANPVDAIKYE